MFLCVAAIKVVICRHCDSIMFLSTWNSSPSFQPPSAGAAVNKLMTKIWFQDNDATTLSAGCTYWSWFSQDCNDLQGVSLLPLHQLDLTKTIFTWHTRVHNYTLIGRNKTNDRTVSLFLSFSVQTGVFVASSETLESNAIQCSPFFQISSISVRLITQGYFYSNPTWGHEI